MSNVDEPRWLQRTVKWRTLGSFAGIKVQGRLATVVSDFPFLMLGVQADIAQWNEMTPRQCFTSGCLCQNVIQLLEASGRSICAMNAGVQSLGYGMLLRMKFPVFMAWLHSSHSTKTLLSEIHFTAGSYLQVECGTLIELALIRAS